MRERLQQWGVNIEEALIPFMGDMKEYERALHDYLRDSAFRQLEFALLENDVRTALEAAERLQNGAGRLGLMPMYEVLYNIVEPLRLLMPEGLKEDFEQLLVLRGQLDSM